MRHDGSAEGTSGPCPHRAQRGKINHAMRRILAASALALAAFGAQAVAAPSRTKQTIHFAGLQRAVQCFPGAMRPGERRPVFLSWKAASGGGTPPSEFVYQIYMSRTSGAENFSAPNWSVEGKLSFRTPKLPANRFFVVRARDRFGQQDHNTVQRQAENPCV